MKAIDLRPLDVLTLAGRTGVIEDIWRMGRWLRFFFHDGTEATVDAYNSQCDRNDIKVERDGVQIWPVK